MSSIDNTTAKDQNKYYILDTSVLLHQPESLFSFGKHKVILPVVVLDEIDNFKKGSLEINRSARRVINYLDELRQKGPINQSVTRNEQGGTLTVELNGSQSSATNDPHKLGFQYSADNKILGTAVSYQNHHPEALVIVVTKDINMRVKAEALGLRAEDFLADQLVDIDEMYTGELNIVTQAPVIDDFYREKFINREQVDPERTLNLYPHQFITLTTSQDNNSSALGRYRSGTEEIVALRDDILEVWGLRPLNKEQRFAFEVLLDDSIPLVTISGKAGTGKTIMAIAAGLHKVLNEKRSRRLSIYRPVVPMGRDIGFLPGTEQEKLAPWMQPIFDNLEYLLEDNNNKQKKNNGNSQLEYLLDSNILDIRALTYIRGRSLPDQYIIVDEAQNLTPHEAKTIITRAGHGTKLIFTGDPYQIDHPYLDSTSNGLTHTVEKFRNQPLSAHVTLVKGERSALAELASEIMEQ